ncbi:MAG: IclR family transcriptional regulator [Thermomicrobiales bacterium]
MIDLAVPASGIKLNRSVQRVVSILRALAEAKPSLGLSEVSTAVELPESTVYRMLATLQGEGFVERTPDGSGRYQLGLEVFRLGSSVLKRLGIGQESLSYLEALAEETHETVNLGALHGFHVLYLQKVESQHPLRASLTVGSATVPAHCSANGKALLAHLAEDELTALLDEHSLSRRGPNTITDRATLLKELARIRAQGFSVDDLEFAADIRAVAAPIRDHHGEVIAAVAIAAPATRLSRERAYELAPRIVEAARHISTRLGHWS